MQAFINKLYLIISTL